MAREVKTEHFFSTRLAAGIASGHEMGIKQQGRGMGLQAAAIASQIDLNNSQAEKNRADAKKTAGVDTTFTEVQTEYYKELKLLTGDQRNLTTANYEVALQKQGLLVEEARKLGLENNWTEEEREALFLSKVEKGIVWICGEKCNIDDERTYINLLNYHRSRASRLYGDNPTDWDKKKYLKRLKDQRNIRQRAMQHVGAMRRKSAMQTAPCGMESLFST
jgi:hypothetical protein